MDCGESFTNDMESMKLPPPINVRAPAIRGFIGRNRLRPIALIVLMVATGGARPSWALDCPEYKRLIMMTISASRLNEQSLREYCRLVDGLEQAGPRGFERLEESCNQATNARIEREAWEAYMRHFRSAGNCAKFGPGAPVPRRPANGVRQADVSDRCLAIGRERITTQCFRRDGSSSHFRSVMVRASREAGCPSTVYFDYFDPDEQRQYTRFVTPLSVDVCGDVPRNLQPSARQ